MTEPGGQPLIRLETLKGKKSLMTQASYLVYADARVPQHLLEDLLFVLFHSLIYAPQPQSHRPVRNKHLTFSYPVMGRRRILLSQRPERLGG